MLLHPSQIKALGIETLVIGTAMDGLISKGGGPLFLTAPIDGVVLATEATLGPAGQGRGRHLPHRPAQILTLPQWGMVGKTGDAIS